MTGLYIAGRLKDIHPTVLEALWLIEGLGRMGLDSANHTAEVTVRTGKRARPLSAPLLECSPEDMCLFVTVRAPRMRLLEVNAGNPGEGEIDFEETVEWRGCIGPVPSWSEEEFAAKWVSAVSWLSDAPESEIAPSRRMSASFGALAGLEELLRQRGFEVKR